MASNDTVEWEVIHRSNGSQLVIKRPPMCDDCGVYPSDPPSKFCPGCEAYREHQR